MGRDRDRVAPFIEPASDALLDRGTGILDEDGARLRSPEGEGAVLEPFDVVWPVS